jgi:uncharacterized RDD family membrane protein YckC
VNAPILYARFWRRVQALALDTLVVMTLLVVTVLGADVMRATGGVGRVMVALVVAEMLLYEPLLVWRFGATLGHRWMNLRIVDERTGGHPTLARAALRFVAKTVLGIASFTTMALTTRHQAVHDRVAGTTVRIRDVARASPWEFHVEREPSAEEGLPSRLRRTVAIIVYATGVYVAYALVVVASVSASCLDRDVCTGAERVAATALSFVWLLAIVGIVIAGWRGRLPGARGARPRAPLAPVG